MVLFWKKSDQPNKMVTASVALHAKEMEGHQGRSGVFHLGGSKVIREAWWGLGRLRTGNSPTRIGISPIKIGISPIKIGISPIKIGISPIKIGISPTIWPKWCASDRLDLDHLAGRNCKPRLLLDNSEDHRALVLEPQKTAICKGNPLSNIFLGFPDREEGKHPFNHIWLMTAPCIPSCPRIPLGYTVYVTNCHIPRVNVVHIPEVVWYFKSVGNHRLAATGCKLRTTMSQVARGP